MRYYNNISDVDDHDLVLRLRALFEVPTLWNIITL